MSEERVVEIPPEVQGAYETDSELDQLQRELLSTSGEAQALIEQFQRKIDPLRDKVADLEEQIRARKVELVRGLGLAFASFEELNQKAHCRDHPEAKAVWVPVGKLAPEATGKGVRGKLLELCRYELKCTECYLEEKVSPDKFAHDCPNCGIVRGVPQKFSDRATGRYAAYQDSYIYYHCRVCGMELGFVIIYGLSR